MRNQTWWALAALTATLGTTLVLTSPALSQKPTPRLTMTAALAKKTKVDEDDVKLVLEALGPVLRDKLANGEVVELPGLGTFRVVRLPEHRDLVKGRPAIIEATNNVEFLPTAEVIQAANSKNAVPATTVPQFEYNPLPDQTKSQRAPYIRTPGIRTP